MKVYQHAGMVKDPYAVVFSSENIDQNEGYHLLNKRVDDYKLIRVESKPNGHSGPQPALVILDFTAHELPHPYPETADKEIVYVRLKAAKGHIPLHENWG